MNMKTLPRRIAACLLLTACALPMLAVPQTPATPKAAALFAKAYELDAAGLHRDAVDVYEFALQQAPKSGSGWYYLGAARIGLGDLDGAIEAISKARGLGDRLENAKAEQIHDELVMLREAIRPPRKMRSDWHSSLAQAIRLYQPPTDRRYRITNTTESYVLSEVDMIGRKHGRRDYLAGCGGSVPAGMERATSGGTTISVVSWPALIAQYSSIIDYSTCLSGKLQNSKTNTGLYASLTLMSGLPLSNEQENEQKWKYSISGNPYAMKPGESIFRMEYLDKESPSINIRQRTARLSQRHSDIDANIAGPILDVVDRSTSTVDGKVHELTFSGGMHPFPHAFGIKVHGSSDMILREEVTSKTGSLESPGDVLEYVLEVDYELKTSAQIQTVKEVSRIKIERIK